VPIDREPLAGATSYGTDRAFVSLALADGDFAGSPEGNAQSRLLDELRQLGHPVIRIQLDDPIDLAGEMLRWEVATAFAGAVLGIDAFDQPNVEEAKELTRRLLAGAGDRSASQGEASQGEDVALSPQRLGEEGLAAALRGTLDGRRPPAYLAVQAFIAGTPERDASIARIRAALGATGCATTGGYGPRFLHSTGQLHKGGPPTGWFLQLTADHPHDREIPGWPYSFGRLIDAQARGDREAIRAHDRPVVHVHLGPDVDADLGTLERAVARATS
jgi:hypothetical protein